MNKNIKLDYGGKGYLGLRTVAGGNLYGSSSALCLAGLPDAGSLRLVLRIKGGLK